MKHLKITAAILLIGVTYSFAQSSETKEKLKNLKGEVTKITVETTDGKVELTGEDAESVFKKLKSSKKNLVFIHKDMDDDFEKEMTIDIDKDGEKVIIIKKNIDGKEIIKKYKGQDAEKFMNEHGGEHGMKIISEDGCVKVLIEGDDEDLHWTSEKDGKMMNKKINVEVKDGIKKVTITTTEDGKEKVEVYEVKKPKNS